MRLTTIPPISAFLFAAAALWPTLVGLASYAMMSPLERAIAQAWCGLSPYSGAELFGHCAACYAGSAMLAAMGWLALDPDRRSVAPVLGV